jgi:predicted negative regulator of RcsB-dependent stress response
VEIPILKYALWTLAALAVFVVLCVAGAAGCKEYNRYQKRADAKNTTQIVKQQIKTAAEQAKVNRAQIEATKAEAEKRYQEAIGIKRAQEEINRTLTPLYVQHEAIQKLPQARAIYVPSGNQGIPQVQDVGTPVK